MSRVMPVAAIMGVTTDGSPEMSGITGALISPEVLTSGAELLTSGAEVLTSDCDVLTEDCSGSSPDGPPPNRGLSTVKTMYTAAIIRITDSTRPMICTGCIPPP